MQLPFTAEQLFDVFEHHNVATWPAPVLGYVLGIAAVLYAIKRTPISDSVVCSILALFWLWIGAVYHIAFLATIAKAAYLFGALCIVQGAVFLVVGAFRGRICFGFERNPFCIVGAILVLYALVAYPLLGIRLGHAYPQSPAFGLAPCPTTIFTFGLLLWTRTRVPRYILAIPALWSLVGSTAAYLGVLEDAGLLATGVVGTALIVYRDRRRSPPQGLGNERDV